MFSNHCVIAFGLCGYLTRLDRYAKSAHLSQQSNPCQNGNLLSTRPPHHPHHRWSPWQPPVRNVSWSVCVGRIVPIIIFFKGCQILSGFGEFTLLHTLTNIPMNKGTLGVHKVEFVVETGPGLGNGSSVAKHGHTTIDRRELASGSADGPEES